MCQGLIHVPVLELLLQLALEHRRIEQNGLGLREDCLCALKRKWWSITSILIDGWSGKAGWVCLDLERTKDGLWLVGL